MKKSLLIFAALCCMMVAKAQTQPNNEIWYTSLYNNVVTPDSDAFDVSIVSNTYKDGKGVITFSGELTSIGEFAFSAKNSLVSITIPASVTSIGEFAFSECTSLATIAFAEGSQLETIGNTAFTSTAISGVLTLPASLKNIGAYAFSYTKINAVTIPASVTSIGNEAFNYCNSLESLTFVEGSHLENIGESAFYSAGIKGELMLPASLKSVGNQAFSGCSGITTLTFAEDSQLETIGEKAFDGMGISGELTLPASLKNIGFLAFAGCQLTKVYMSSEDLSGISNEIFIESAVIVVSSALYEAYRDHFSGKNKVEIPLNEWKEYTKAKIEAAMQTVNTLSDTDRNTIATHISTIENATTIDGTMEAYYAALDLIDQQKAFEERVRSVLEEWGTRQPGTAIEIEGEDGKTIQLYKIKKVKFIKVNEG